MVLFRGAVPAYASHASRDDKDLAVALRGYAAQPITNASSLSLLVKLGLDIGLRRESGNRHR